MDTPNWESSNLTVAHLLVLTVTQQAALRALLKLTEL
jgi:hypothetical protein